MESIIKYFNYLLYPSILVCASSLIGNVQAQVLSNEIVSQKISICEEERKRPQGKVLYIKCIESILEESCEDGYENDSTLYQIHKKLFSINLDLNNVFQGIHHLNAAVASANRYYGIGSLESILTLQSLAIVQENFSDNFFSAIVTRERVKDAALAFDFDSLSTYQQLEITENTIRLASLYGRIGEREKAVKTLAETRYLRDKLLSQQKHLNNFPLDLMTSYTFLLIGRSAEAEQIMSAQHQFQDSLLNQPFNYNINELFFSKVLLAEIYIAQKKYPIACELAQEADDLLMTYEPNAMLYEAYGKFILGKALLKAKRYAESEAVLEAFTNKFNQFSQTRYESTNFVNLAQLNELLARCYHEQYLASSQQTQLEAATLSIQQAQNALQNAWHNFNNQDDLRYNLKEYYEIFETAFHIQQSLYQATKNEQHLYESLQLMERSRNVNLRTSLRSRAIAEQEGIPLRLLDREQALRKGIFESEYQLDQIKGIDTLALQNQLQKKKEELLQLNEKINEISPDFTRAMHENKIPTAHELKAYLDQHQQTIIYYVSGEEGVYLIGLSPKGNIFQRLAVGQDSLNQLTNHLRSVIYTNPSNPSSTSLQQLAHSSHQLYQLLLEPIEDIATNRLVIIPDGPLEIIPFSLLLSKDISEATPLKSWPFAVKDYSFSYAYSLELLLQEKENTTTPTKQKILAFAPNFRAGILRGDSTRFQGELKSNQDEVAFIEDQFDCQAYYEDHALLSTFREEVSDYAVLHLATHAAANTAIGQYSYLAFSEVEKYDHQLEVGELYGMDIPAEMVVLSACETGLGEWQRGEGVIGLERAFSYAGAKSILTTHWKVSDRASAKLMSEFYNQLSLGCTKDIALQQAQLTFMQKNDNWLAHPFFWAGFVQKGSTSPLDIPRRQPKWPWLMGGLIVAGSIIYQLRSKKVA
ncbi:MAG: CHAT domain-containing protein [Bacteroidota bacterium]